MGEKLLLVSVSGVQEYISRAKKTADLYGSSHRVIKQILWIKKRIQREFESCELLLGEGVVGDPPNFFIAKLQTDKTSEEVEKQILNVLMKEGERCSEDLPCFITVCSMKENYQEAYKFLYRKFQAYKNNRLNAFLPKQESEEQVTSHICSICGIRLANSLVDEEYLCSECRNKRKEGKRIAFPSTENFGSLYYALVRIDIDDMGMYISGEKGWERDEELHNYQKKISRAANEFFIKEKEFINQEVKKVTENENAVIYAGGDDMLFFCPVFCIEDITKKLESDWIEMCDSGMTFSKSIIVAHCKEPLRYVLKKSRESMEQVKQHYRKDGKGGCCFSVLYRGSGSRMIFVKGDRMQNHFYSLISAFCRHQFSRSVIFQMEEEFTGWGENFGVDEYTDLRFIMNNETKRIVGRKSEGKSSEEKQELTDLLINLRNDVTKEAKDGFYIDFNAYFDLMHIAEKLASFSEK